MGSGGDATILNDLGTVILVPFPFTDLSGAKQRPALVVSPQGFHPDDVILCAITSQVPPRLSRWEIPLNPPDLQNARLPKPSIIRVGKLFTMHRGLIRGTYGHLTESKLHAVLEQLRALFSSAPQ